jgi:AcrR family transcriptional regulator
VTAGLPETRQQLLAATKALVETTAFADISLARVATAAGVSRQAVYLHFGSRSGLLLALVDWMDQSGRLRSLMATALEHTDPRQALLGAVAAAATYNADVAGVSLALRDARRTDAPAAAAWQDRMHARVDGIRSVVAPVAAAGGLKPEWTIEQAADMISALLSPTVYEDLVIDGKWPLQRYVAHIVRLVATMVTSEDAEHHETPRLS